MTRARGAWIVALLLVFAACGSKGEKNTDESRAPVKRSARDGSVPPTVGNAPPDYAIGDTLLPHRELTLDSKVLGEERRINIYVPPDYDDSIDARYPILYMPDGGTREDFPHLTHTVDTAIRAGHIRPIVVVGIENTQRRRDLTGPTEVAEDKKVAPVVGGSATFRRFIRDELVPEIQGQIRGDGTTAIIGESLAGLFVVETFFLAPDMFDIYIAIDPSLQWNGSELGHKAVERLKSGSWRGRRLYLSSAGTTSDDGNSEHVALLVAALKKHPPEALRLTYEPRPDEEHATIYRSTKLEILTSMFPQRATRPVLPDFDSTVVGRFELPGQAVVSDPAHDVETATTHRVLDHVRPGTWEARSFTSAEGNHALLVVHVEHGGGPFDWEKAGTTGVDSGMVGVFAPAHFDDPIVVPENFDYGPEGPIQPDNTWYSMWARLTMNAPGVAVIPSAAVSTSGYGDGEYAISVARNADGVVIAISVRFI